MVCSSMAAYAFWSASAHEIGKYEPSIPKLHTKQATTLSHAPLGFPNF